MAKGIAILGGGIKEPMTKIVRIFKFEDEF